MRRTHRYVIIGLFVVAIAGATAYSVHYLQHHRAAQLIGTAVVSVHTDQPVVALTFDDGPNPPYTEQILDVLDEYGAHATFFVIGQNAARYPDTVKAIYQRGNEVGNHSWDHAKLMWKTPAFVQHEIDATDREIRATGYAGPIYFRAPFAHKFLVLPYLLWRAGRPHILYDIVLGDWDRPPAADMLAALAGQMKPGSIILLHDGDKTNGGDRANTVELVRLILDRYTREGYRFVTISELLTYESG